MPEPGRRPSTVDWTSPRSAAAAAAISGAEGLRERKKRQQRQQLTDVATAMFLDRVREVRVAEIAEACDVSEKTVFDYFPTKESLVLDHPDAMATLRTGLADASATPLEAVLRILADELTALASWSAGHDDPAEASARVGQFNALIQSTPALRAYQREMTEQLVAVAAEVQAVRQGMRADDPEPHGARTPTEVGRAVTSEVQAAARLLDGGLATSYKRAANASRTRRQASSPASGS
jgi:AcrR family transcriptional regulator